MNASAAEARSTTRVSVADNGDQANGFSTDPAISSTGRYVAFLSGAPNLVRRDTNNGVDVFVRDRSARRTERVNISTSGAQANGLEASNPSISADGRHVAFVSDASNLVPRDTNGTVDVFVRDRTERTTVRISVSSSGGQANARSYEPAISANGRFVAFTSDASNLIRTDRNGARDVFLHDLLTGRTIRVSPAAGVFDDPSISAKGRYIAFVGHQYDEPETAVWLRDRVNRMTRIASVDSSGTPVTSAISPSLSVTGRYVVFTFGYIEDGGGQIMWRDLRSGVTKSVAAQADSFCDAATVSRDGRHVVFETDATNLDPRDTGWRDVYIADITTGAIRRVSVPIGGGAPSGSSGRSAISADGAHVAFASELSNLVPADTNNASDVFVRDAP